MKEKFLRNTSEVSLLKNDSKTSMKVISNRLSRYIMDNDEYFKRCLSQVENGKAELRKKLDDVRKVIFNQDDLINWFYKIKEDAKSETDMIFIENDASFRMEDKIDFERAGFLAGIFDEAERYLTIISAIEPMDINKPHYSILDRLEKLDEEYINSGNIPGYYAVQKDKRVLKQKFELKSLDDYWTDYLSLKDKHRVTEGFGNLKYLLSQYHFEFIWELTKITPREDIKQFLNFQLKNYSGDALDFLNHIEFRIMPDLSRGAGSNYPIYKLLFKDWLKEKRNKLNQAGAQYLLESVVSVAASFVDNITEFRKSQDENKYNISLCLLLNQRFSSKGWSAKDQSMGGSTDSESKANKAGIAFRDIIVADEKNHHLSAMECFRLKYVPAQVDTESEITKHLTKIFRNEPLGVSPLFILVYCETKSFLKTWEKYLSYIQNIDFKNYKLIELISKIEVKPERASIKIAMAKHIRETNEIDVYHVFINMYP